MTLYDRWRHAVAPRFLSIDGQPPPPPPPLVWPDWLTTVNVLRVATALSLLALGGGALTLRLVAPWPWSLCALPYVAVCAGARADRRWPGLIALLTALAVLVLTHLGFGLWVLAAGFAMTREGVDESRGLLLLLLTNEATHVVMLIAGIMSCIAAWPPRPRKRT